MCIIIYQPKDRSVSRERIVQAQKANPDGWGIMWADKGEVHTYKDIEWPGKFWGFFHHLHRQSCAFHFRTASSGGISIKHCHPQYIKNPDNEYDFTLAFMQNGNLFEYSNYFPGINPNDGKTDVERFNEEVLLKLSRNSFMSGEISPLDDYLQHSLSKMIIIDHQGSVRIFNEQAGEWKDGCWYSNGGIKGYVGYGFSGAYQYNEKDIRHKGGLISIQFLPPEKRKNWCQCPSCKGWFHFNDMDDFRIFCKSCLIWNRLIVKME